MVIFSFDNCTALAGGGEGETDVASSHHDAPKHRPRTGEEEEEEEEEGIKRDKKEGTSKRGR